MRNIILNLFPLNDIKLFFSFLSLQYELKSLKQPPFSSTPRAKLYYDTLLNFLDSNSKDANSFINCETFPFDQTLVHKDKFYECLKMQNEIIEGKSKCGFL
jgi:hypothetical protein